MATTNTKLTKVSEQDQTLAEAVQEITNLAKRERKSKLTSVEIVNEGNKLVLPADCSPREAIKWLQEEEIEKERTIQFRREIDCYPVDGAFALKNALELIYGKVHMKGRQTMFGEIPPAMIEIPVSVDEIAQVPWGRIQPFGIDGYIETSMSLADGRMKFIISGIVKRKNENAMTVVANLTESMVQNNSIYRGQAIRMDLSWMDLPLEEQERLTPTDIAPKFLDTRNFDWDKLLLNQSTKFELETSILPRLQRPEMCKKLGRDIKHGILFSGPYGTGKTYCAKMLAARAVENGYTFLYLNRAEDFKHAIRMVENGNYAPAVIFAEDIDRLINRDEGRNAKINEMLNLMDGIDTKHLEIISVLTSNHRDNISRGFVRAGRIDTEVMFGPPEPDLAWLFVEQYTKDAEGNITLEPMSTEDKLDIGNALQGFVPAFIKEVANKAVLHAAYRHGEDVNGHVTKDDILQSIQSCRHHAKLADEFGLINEEVTVHNGQQ